MADAFTKQKRLRWSRSVRDSAYAKFVAARDSLRALYDQIDFEKAELLQTREDFGKANARVKKHRSELREVCLTHEFPDDYPVCRDANSSDGDHNTDSATEPESADEN